MYSTFTFRPPELCSSLDPKRFLPCYALDADLVGCPVQGVQHRRGNRDSLPEPQLLGLELDLPRHVDCVATLGQIALMDLLGPAGPLVT